MDDPTATATPATTPPADPAPAATPEATPPEQTSPIVGPDGKFADGWRDRIPEEYREEKCLDVLGDDFGNMVKNYVYTQKMRGKNTIVVPTELSSQAEWDAFYAMTGRPESVEGYKIEKPEGLPDDLWDQARMDEFKKQAWDLGFNEKQVAALVEFDNQRTMAAIQAQQEQSERETKEAEKALRSKWGAAYDERMHLANAFIAKTTDEESGQRQAILDMAGNNPTFIEWVAEWGMKTAESKGIDTSQFTQTPMQNEERMKELMATPGYLDGRLKKENPYGFEKIQRELEEIRTVMAKQ